ncbi:MAG TPA: hypothetical protein VNA15_11465 [Candidatus Angelobacter sp.]|nr:hypothetical protein [Candidatus Angelobacter sp.]
MQIVRPLIRIIVSLVGALIPLLFLSGTYSPLGSSALGSYLPNVLGSQSALYSSLQNSIGISLPVGLLPFGAAGGTGLIVYGVVQRVLGGITRATYSAPRIDPSEMLRSMQGRMPWMNMQGSAPRTLPQDMTMSQFTILSTCRRGSRKPKDIAKALSMDKKAVENETNILRRNGYLTKDNKLTTKGLNSLS